MGASPGVGRAGRVRAGRIRALASPGGKCGQQIRAGAGLALTEWAPRTQPGRIAPDAVPPAGEEPRLPLGEEVRGPAGGAIPSVPGRAHRMGLLALLLSSGRDRSTRSLTAARKPRHPASGPLVRLRVLIACPPAFERRPSAPYGGSRPAPVRGHLAREAGPAGRGTAGGGMAGRRSLHCRRVGFVQNAGKAGQWAGMILGRG